ncbi:MAG: hypothetical protein AAGJ35_10040, partial [Myxococcota bacterium]
MGTHKPNPLPSIYALRFSLRTLPLRDLQHGHTQTQPSSPSLHPEIFFRTLPLRDLQHGHTQTQPSSFNLHPEILLHVSPFYDLHPEILPLHTPSPQSTHWAHTS